MDKITIPEENDIIPRVLVGDVKEQLDRIPEKSIDCIITSPPYWQQRDYGVEGQLGLEKKAEKYIDNMVKIGNKLKTVLHEDGSYFLNIGDKYKDKNLQMIPSRVATKMQKKGWVLRNFIIWYKPNHMPSPIEDRFTNTWEPIFFFVKDTGKYTTPDYNFYLDRIRVPYKSKNKEEYPPKKILKKEDLEELPESLKNKDDLPATISIEEYESLPDILKNESTNDYEGKFKNTKRINLGASPGARLSVNGVYYSGPYRKYNPDELEVIKYLRKWKKKAGLTNSEIAERTGIKKTTVSHWFRTDKGGRCLPNKEGWLKLKDVLNFDDKYDNEMTDLHYKLQGINRNAKGKNPGDMWSMNTGNLSKSHFSIFPEELPKRVIKAVTPENGIVLDPFAGSGTTAKVAKELNRRSILIELQEEYIDIIKERCKEIEVIKGDKIERKRSNQVSLQNFNNI